jgi:hypothetical protein
MEGRLRALGVRDSAAPDWLLQAVPSSLSGTAAISTGSGTQRSGRPWARRVAGPAEDFNAFGQRVDNRDHYMRDLIWAAVVNWRRECPIPPTEARPKPR